MSFFYTYLLLVVVIDGRVVAAIGDVVQHDSQQLSTFSWNGKIQKLGMKLRTILKNTNGLMPNDCLVNS